VQAIPEVKYSSLCPRSLAELFKGIRQSILSLLPKTCHSSANICHLAPLHTNTMSTNIPKTDTGTSDVRKDMLGGLRLRNEETNEIILIPTPTNDPNDPLNW
jgi:hypothetical protein